MTLLFSRDNYSQQQKGIVRGKMTHGISNSFFLGFQITFLIISGLVNPHPGLRTLSLFLSSHASAVGIFNGKSLSLMTRAKRQPLTAAAVGKI